MVLKNTDKWDEPEQWTPINMERAGVEERRTRAHINYVMGRQRGDPDVVGRRLDPATTAVQKLPDPVQKLERRLSGEDKVGFRVMGRRGRPRKVLTDAELLQAPGRKRTPRAAKPAKAAPEPKPARTDRLTSRSKAIPADPKPMEFLGVRVPDEKERRAQRINELASKAVEPSRFAGAIRSAIDNIIKSEAMVGAGVDRPKLTPQQRRDERRKRLRAEEDADIIDSKPVLRGRTGVPKKTRNAIRAAVRRARRRNPKVDAMTVKARVEREFSVRITRANFYASYWTYNDPNAQETE